MGNRNEKRTGSASFSLATYKEKEDMRERFVQQKQKVNEGFWGTLQANTMHKETYM